MTLHPRAVGSLFPGPCIPGRKRRHILQANRVASRVLLLITCLPLGSRMGSCPLPTSCGSAGSSVRCCVSLSPPPEDSRGDPWVREAGLSPHPTVAPAMGGDALFYISQPLGFLINNTSRCEGYRVSHRRNTRGLT